MQTTLLGLAIAVILALLAALIGPYFIDWSQFRPEFEREASRVIGMPVRVDGAIDARLLPTPSLGLRGVAIGARSDANNVSVEKLDVEFSLGDLMRGEWRANEMTLNGLVLELGVAFVVGPVRALCGRRVRCGTGGERDRERAERAA